jgi:hypothetical protein
LPAGISLLIMLGLLVAGIAERRQGHIGRVAIFLNAILLWEIFYGSFASLPLLYQYYLNIGSIVGLIAIIAYIPRRSLPTEFYTFAYLFYGSFSVLLAIIGAVYFNIPLI